MMIVQLKEEDIKHRVEVSISLDLYEKYLIDAIEMLRRILPLHRQVQNLYKQNRSLQAESRTLKKEVQTLIEEIITGNLRVLSKAVLELDNIRPKYT